MATQVAPNSAASNKVCLLPYRLEGTGRFGSPGTTVKVGAGWFPLEAPGAFPASPTAGGTPVPWLMAPPKTTFQACHCHQPLPPSPHRPPDLNPSPPSHEGLVVPLGPPSLSRPLTSRSLIPWSQSLCHVRSHVHRPWGFRQGRPGPLLSHPRCVHKTTLTLVSLGGREGMDWERCPGNTGVEGGMLRMSQTTPSSSPFWDGGMFQNCAVLQPSRGWWDVPELCCPLRQHLDTEGH